jgi:tetratricopeptide (TPR) repeat protein
MNGLRRILTSNQPMQWTELRKLLDEEIEGESVFTTLLGMPEVWESDAKTLERAAYFAYEKGQYPLCIGIIEAMHARGIPMLPQQSIKIQHLRADALHAEGKYAEAIRVYDEILSKEKSDIAFANRALARWESGDFQEALRDYLAATKLNPGNAIAFRGAGEMLIKTGSPHEAISVLNEAIALDANYGPAFTALGVAHYNCEDWVKSYRALKRALEINPDDKVASRGVRKLEDALGIK